MNDKTFSKVNVYNLTATVPRTHIVYTIAITLKSEIIEFVYSG